ncbi:unnamed protein product [Amoebophrya sp. A120]|nr:unnamed protein product [Amoebophrya sp. A120]|eukprot:GSA120T00021378001.1
MQSQQQLGGPLHQNGGAGAGQPQQQQNNNLVLEEEMDENYEPTEEEIAEYAAWLGMDLEKDKDLLWIAKEGLKAPLPNPWKPCQTQEGEIFYFNFETGDSVWDHPCDEHYRKVFDEEKKKRDQIAIQAQAGKRSSAAQDSSSDAKDKKEKKKKRKSSVATELAPPMPTPRAMAATTTGSSAGRPSSSRSRLNSAREEAAELATPRISPSLELSEADLRFQQREMEFKDKELKMETEFKKRRKEKERELEQKMKQDLELKLVEMKQQIEKDFAHERQAFEEKEERTLAQYKSKVLQEKQLAEDFALIQEKQEALQRETRAAQEEAAAEKQKAQELAAEVEEKKSAAALLERKLAEERNEFEKKLLTEKEKLDAKVKSIEQKLREEKKQALDAADALSSRQKQALEERLRRVSNQTNEEKDYLKMHYEKMLQDLEKKCEKLQSENTMLVATSRGKMLVTGSASSGELLPDKKEKEQDQMNLGLEEQAVQSSSASAEVELQTARQDIAVLEQKVQLLEQQKQDELAEFKQTKQELQKQVDLWESRHKTAMARADELELVKIRQEQAVDSLKNSLRFAEVEKTEWEQKFEEATREKNALLTEKSEVILEMKEQNRDEVDRLRALVDALQLENTKFEKENEKLSAKTKEQDAELQLQNGPASTTKRNADAEVREAQQKVELLELQKQELQNKQNAMESLLQIEKARKQEIEEQKNDRIQEIESRLFQAETRAIEAEKKILAEREELLAERAAMNKRTEAEASPSSTPEDEQRRPQDAGVSSLSRRHQVEVDRESTKKSSNDTIFNDQQSNLSSKGHQENENPSSQQSHHQPGVLPMLSSPEPNASDDGTYAVSDKSAGIKFFEGEQEIDRSEVMELRVEKQKLREELNELRVKLTEEKRTKEEEAKALATDYEARLSEYEKSAEQSKEKHAFELNLKTQELLNYDREIQSKTRELDLKQVEFENEIEAKDAELDFLKQRVKEQREQLMKRSRERQVEAEVSDTAAQTSRRNADHPSTTEEQLPADEPPAIQQESAGPQFFKAIPRDILARSPPQATKADTLSPSTSSKVRELERENEQLHNEILSINQEVEKQRLNFVQQLQESQQQLVTATVKITESGLQFEKMQASKEGLERELATTKTELASIQTAIAREAKLQKQMTPKKSEESSPRRWKNGRQLKDVGTLADGEDAKEDAFSTSDAATGTETEGDNQKQKANAATNTSSPPVKFESQEPSSTSETDQLVQQAKKTGTTSTDVVDEETRADVKILENLLQKSKAQHEEKLQRKEAELEQKLQLMQVELQMQKQALQLQLNEERESLEQHVLSLKDQLGKSELLVVEMKSKLKDAEGGKKAHIQIPQDVEVRDLMAERLKQAEAEKKTATEKLEREIADLQKQVVLLQKTADEADELRDEVAALKAKAPSRDENTNGAAGHEKASTSRLSAETLLQQQIDKYQTLKTEKLDVDKKLLDVKAQFDVKDEQLFKTLEERADLQRKVKKLEASNAVLKEQSTKSVIDLEETRAEAQSKFNIEETKHLSKLRRLTAEHEEELNSVREEARLDLKRCVQQNEQKWRSQVAELEEAHERLRKIHLEKDRRRQELAAMAGVPPGTTSASDRKENASGLAGSRAAANGDELGGADGSSSTSTSAEVITLKMKKQHLETEVETLQSEVDVLYEQNKEKNSKILQLEHDLATAKQASESQVKQSEKQREKLLEQQQQKFQTEKVALQTEKKVLEEAFEEKADEVRRLEQLLADKVRDKEKQIRELKLEIAKLTEIEKDFRRLDGVSSSTAGLVASSAMVVSGDHAIAAGNVITDPDNFLSPRSQSSGALGRAGAKEEVFTTHFQSSSSRSRPLLHSEEHQGDVTTTKKNNFQQQKKTLQTTAVLKKSLTDRMALLQNKLHAVAKEKQKLKQTKQELERERDEWRRNWSALNGPGEKDQQQKTSEEVKVLQATREDKEERMQKLQTQKQIWNERNQELNSNLKQTREQEKRYEQQRQQVLSEVQKLTNNHHYRDDANLARRPAPGAQFDFDQGGMLLNYSNKVIEQENYATSISEIATADAEEITVDQDLIQLPVLEDETVQEPGESEFEIDLTEKFYAQAPSSSTRTSNGKKMKTFEPPSREGGTSSSSNGRGGAATAGVEARSARRVLDRNSNNKTSNSSFRTKSFATARSYERATALRHALEQKLEYENFAAPGSRWDNSAHHSELLAKTERHEIRVAENRLKESMRSAASEREREPPVWFKDSLTGNMSGFAGGPHAGATTQSALAGASSATLSGIGTSYQHHMHPVGSMSPRDRKSIEHWRDSRQLFKDKLGQHVSWMQGLANEAKAMKHRAWSARGDR